MKKLISLAVLLMFSAFAFAQKPGTADLTPGQRADQFTSRIDKQLSLSAKQRKDVHRLALRKEQQLESLRLKKGMRKELMDQQRRQINTEFQDGMKKVLTEKQYAKWMERKKLKARVGAKSAAKSKMYREKNMQK